MRRAEEQDPDWIIAAPPCTAFSSLQNLTKDKPGGAEKLQSKMQEALVHLEFCVKIYRHQNNQGLYFLHEHPPSMRAAGGCHAWRT